MRMGSTFQESQGQKFIQQHKILKKQKWEIPGYWDVTTSIGTSEEEPKFTVLNIPGDQDEDILLDLIVLPTGDVKVTMRNPRLGEMGVQRGTAYLGEETMVFKTKENGGAFPAVNQVLAELAEKMARANKRKPGPFDKVFA